jgi:hypothetical protein
MVASVIVSLVMPIIIFFSWVGLVKETIGEKDNRSVAIAAFSDGNTGDVTALGDYFRDRIEEAVVKSGFTGIPRRDVPVLLDESSVSVKIFNEADLVITGRYYIQGDERNQTVELQLRALDTKTGKLAGAYGHKVDLPENWRETASIVRSNIHLLSIESLTSNSAAAPKLSARLDRASALTQGVAPPLTQGVAPPCYPSGAEAKIIVETEPKLHLYILGIAADNTVTIFYPNKYMTDKPLNAEKFVFPPPEHKGAVSLHFYPIEKDKQARESIKVVVSRTPLDFSFLPVPENEIFTGAKGGDLKRVLDVLRAAKDLSETTLRYSVGPGCR